MCWLSITTGGRGGFVLTGIYVVHHRALLWLQGLTFHETEDYTIYPAPILSVTRQRFTKHYFIGDRRVASKIGAGIFQNAYGHGANVVTAGQKDYQMRMMQIEKQREDYYRKLGTPPGVPTMKGATAEPENTHEGYNTIIKELGDHSVPDGWIQRPKRNAVPGTPPGPPVQWDKAEDPDDVQPGYGYVPADTAHHEEIFYYHSDHLGSTSYITDAKANVTQFDAYLPYGELIVDEHSSTEEMPYKFNGKEFDQETGLYYYGARYMNSRTSLWYGVDGFIEKYTSVDGYVYCSSNPIVFIDPYGNRKVVVTGGKDNHNYNSMNFVEASKIQIKGYKRNGHDEKINWLVFDLDYSLKYKEKMTNWAKSYNVELDFITKSSNLIEKINSYSQTSVLVTNLSVFSHGTASNIAFGYENTGYEYSLYDKTSINQLNVYQLSKKSFADNAMIHLYSCNSATPRGFEGKYFQSRKALINAVDRGRSLAEELHNATGVPVWGTIGRTDYSPVVKGQLPKLGGMGGDNSPFVKGQAKAIYVRYESKRK